MAIFSKTGWHRIITSSQCRADHLLQRFRFPTGVRGVLDGMLPPPLVRPPPPFRGAVRPLGGARFEQVSGGATLTAASVGGYP